MKLYDENIIKLKELFQDRDGFESVPWQMIPLDRAPAWPASDQEELILKSDMYMELGGGDSHAVSGMAFTTSEQLVPEDGIFSVRSMSQLSEYPASLNPDYARFTVIRLKKAADDKDAQELYTLFRRIDYLRYHMSLQGVAMRITSSAHREVLRISKTAVKQKITLFRMMKTFLENYRKIDMVEAVQIYYIAIPKGTAGNLRTKKSEKISGDSFVQSADIWNELEKLALSCEDITESLNVIFKGLNMDCSTCGQKAVCDTVDGMRELHEKMKK